MRSRRACAEPVIPAGRPVPRSKSHMPIRKSDACRRRPCVAARCGSLALALVLPLAAQEPSAQGFGVEELRGRAAGFQDESLLARLRQTAALVTAGAAARPAIAAAIHGDHREYRLKIERFLDQLADERWLAREDAERTLIQIGGRALQQIEDRSKAGKTYEERIRCERILIAISAAGKEEAQKDLRFLRGLVITASYLPPDERLQRALVSALAHTDSLIVEAALRALGKLGDDESVAMLEARIDREPPGSGVRRAALSGLGSHRSGKALEVAERLLRTEGALRSSEAAGLLRDLALRDDGAALRTRLGAYLDAIADKSLLVAIYVTLGIEGVLPRWLVILVVSRDLLIVGAFLLSWVMGRPVEVRPLMISKINTTAQILLAAAILGDHAFAADLLPLVAVGLWIVAGLTVGSGAAYLVGWLKAMSADSETGSGTGTSWPDPR